MRISFNTSELVELVQCTQGRASSKLCRKLRVALFKSQETGMAKQEVQEPECMEVDMNTVRKLAYDAWCSNPATVTPQQLAYATQYRYDNELMSEAEAEQYELEMFGTELEE